MNYFILTCTLYITISAALTVWVANVLFRNGKIFLVDICHGNIELADSVNRLLMAGFYLVNIGYICLVLKVGSNINNLPVVVEVLSYKAGVIILTLGAMHFISRIAFFKLCNRAEREHIIKL